MEAKILYFYPRDKNRDVAERSLNQLPRIRSICGQIPFKKDCFTVAEPNKNENPLTPA